MGIRESRWHASIRRARATVAQVREQDRLHRAAQFAGSKLFVALRETFTAQEKANASFFDLDDHERWRKRWAYRGRASADVTEMKNLGRSF
jgi:hypothetical protein